MVFGDFYYFVEGDASFFEAVFYDHEEFGSWFYDVFDAVFDALFLYVFWFDECEVGGVVLGVL